MGWRIIGRAVRLSTFVAVVLFLSPRGATAQTWQVAVRTCIGQQDFLCARRIVEQTLSAAPNDVEALTWRARLLSWDGRNDDAITAYKQVLTVAPADSDVLLGLADAQIWARRFTEALVTLQRASDTGAAPLEVLTRRASALAAMGRTSEALQSYQAALALAPSNVDLKARAQALRKLPAGKHFLTMGPDVDMFSFTDPAASEVVSLVSQWTAHWSTSFTTKMYQRFGAHADIITAEVIHRISENGWVRVGGGGGTRQAIVPQEESTIEFGHAVKFHSGPIRGVELSMLQRNLWFSSSAVSTFGGTALAYLPRDLTLATTIIAARTAAHSGSSDWTPSLSGRLTFPLTHRLRPSLSYAVGTENFSLADQLGSFTSWTIGSGAQLKLTGAQQIDGYIAEQHRSNGQSQVSVGVTYGIHF